jgi:hypothetical protein
MERAKSGCAFPKAARRGMNTTPQLLNFQHFAQSRVLNPTVGHVPCKFFTEMCV